MGEWGSGGGGGGGGRGGGCSACVAMYIRVSTESIFLSFSALGEIKVAQCCYNVIPY